MKFGSDVESVPVLESDEVATSMMSQDSPAATRIAPLVDLPINAKNEKERFNYASFDCGALIRAVNPEASSTISILSNSKDKYMLNKCSADKFVEMELCDDILVDTLILANLEFFSSMFKDFKAYVADRYPPNSGWKLIGAFTAENSRERQIFKIDHPALWARYLRIEFLTHFGQEFYCPLTMVKVYGTSMIEDVKAGEYDNDYVSMVSAPSKTTFQLKDDSIMDESRTISSAHSPHEPETSIDYPIISSILSTSETVSLTGIAKATHLSSSSEITTSQHVAVSNATAAPTLSLPKVDSCAISGTPVESVITTSISSVLLKSPDMHSLDSELVGPSTSSDLIDMSPTSLPDVGANANSGSPGTKESIFKNIMKRLSAVEKSILMQETSFEPQLRDIRHHVDSFELGQTKRLIELFATYKPLYDSEFHAMLEQHSERMAILEAELRAKGELLDERLRVAEGLIEFFDYQINRTIIATASIVILAMLAKYILKLAAALPSRIMYSYNQTSQQWGGHIVDGNGESRVSRPNPTSNPTHPTFTHISHIDQHLISESDIPHSNIMSEVWEHSRYEDRATSLPPILPMTPLNDEIESSIPDDIYSITSDVIPVIAIPLPVPRPSQNQLNDQKTEIRLEHSPSRSHKRRKKRKPSPRINE
ncbi:hypothetical protein BSLG_007295 [Batrachochytrium salamandrivorans]|nr:hypothetical protein BSLG_007295 [Batrachochytrium salamandrivorans]